MGVNKTPPVISRTPIPWGIDENSSFLTGIPPAQHLYRPSSAASSNNTFESFSAAIFAAVAPPGPPPISIKSYVIMKTS
ncbi:MAG: hypothetical protein ACTSQU_13165 [Promethearchaeota archaeon]